MIFELLLLIEQMLTEHVNEIVSIATIAVGINFAANGGFKLFKKPPKVVKCPHLEEEE